ncbi:NUDIX family hydrolase NudH subfamily hydrolase [Reticulomyxa filosa]|uniref:NUDIX family hydrolase NudH subfamily hydrolase n=1 Tax=Reticulomyxa filosa TaxID=46433 RepID=X6NIN0_RETFI|nr:NUDIX family hydrolase NudH subfamily hydrolase [Reticulomyxa filosa]|eukprot:ETO25584.1 NUDIX family hydrolase NudH subfamily hydrolase [Reticulomyxa filosa]
MYFVKKSVCSLCQKTLLNILYHQTKMQKSWTLFGFCNKIMWPSKRILGCGGVKNDRVTCHSLKLVSTTTKGTIAQSFVKAIPKGDDKLRLVCTNCNYVVYSNPKIVSGVVAVSKNRDKLLLCRRAIAPRAGYWYLPAGFLESGESPEQGAQREAKEECNAIITLEGLCGVYAIPKIDQILMYYRGQVINEYDIKALAETEEVNMFSFDQIPWQQLAFPANTRAIKFYMSHPFDNTVETKKDNCFNFLSFFLPNIIHPCKLNSGQVV